MLHRAETILRSPAPLAVVCLKVVGARVRGFSWLKSSGPVIITAFAIVLSAAARLDKHGVRVVGEIPPGLPAISFPWVQVREGGRGGLVWGDVRGPLSPLPPLNRAPLLPPPPLNSSAVGQLQARHSDG